MDNSRPERLHRPLLIALGAFAIVCLIAWLLRSRTVEPALIIACFHTFVATSSISAGLFLGWLVDVFAALKLLKSWPVRAIVYTALGPLLVSYVSLEWSHTTLPVADYVLFLTGCLAGFYWKYIRRLFRVWMKPVS